MWFTACAVFTDLTQRKPRSQTIEIPDCCLNVASLCSCSFLLNVWLYQEPVLGTLDQSRTVWCPFCRFLSRRPVFQSVMTPLWLTCVVGFGRCHYTCLFVIFFPDNEFIAILIHRCSQTPVLCFRMWLFLFLHEWKGWRCKLGSADNQSRDVVLNMNMGYNLS